MNPQAKNIIVLLIASLAVFAAAFWYSENIKRPEQYSIKSGRLPVENSSNHGSDYGSKNLQVSVR